MHSRCNPYHFALLCKMLPYVYDWVIVSLVFIDIWVNKQSSSIGILVFKDKSIVLCYF